MKSLTITTKEMFLGCGEYNNIIDGYVDPDQLIGFALEIDKLFKRVKVYPWAFDFIIKNTDMNALSVVTEEEYKDNMYVLRYLSTFVKLDEFKKKTKEMKFLKDRHFNMVINLSNLTNIQIDNVLKIIEEINIKSDVEYIIVLNEEYHQELLDNIDWFEVVLDNTRFKNIDVHYKEDSEIKKTRFRDEYDTSVNFDVRFQWDFEYDTKRDKELYLHSGDDVLWEFEMAELRNKKVESFFTSLQTKGETQEQSKNIFAFTDEEIEREVEDFKKNGLKHKSIEEIYELIERNRDTQEVKTFEVKKYKDDNQKDVYVAFENSEDANEEFTDEQLKNISDMIRQDEVSVKKELIDRNYLDKVIDLIEIEKKQCKSDIFRSINSELFNKIRGAVLREILGDQFESYKKDLIKIFGFMETDFSGPVVNQSAFDVPVYDKFNYIPYEDMIIFKYDQMDDNEIEDILGRRPLEAVKEEVEDIFGSDKVESEFDDLFGSGGTETEDTIDSDKDENPFE